MEEDGGRWRKMGLFSLLFPANPFWPASVARDVRFNNQEAVCVRRHPPSPRHEEQLLGVASGTEEHRKVLTP